MLTLNDGRNELWQWDTGSKLTVDADCSQVHFSNKVFGRSIDVDVVDGIAIIPDILLQTDKDLTAWAFVGTAENGYTKISNVFKVNKRNKPADYVFTPPEQTSLGELIERLDKIEEEQIPDAVKNAVEDYLEKNPVDVQSVNGKKGAVQLSASDVGARPNTWMPTAQDVGALPSTYTPPNQTAEQVGADPKGTAANAVSQHNTSDDAHNDIRLELKAINDRLTAFFDSDDQTLDTLSEIVSYITNNKTLIESITTSKVSVADIVNNLTTNVANKPLSASQGVVLKGLIDTLSNSLSNYQTKGDYALRSELPTVPTNVSAFTNDAGYLTEHQDISGKLDADKLPEAVNDALAQAKASGEFDGADGRDGVDGKDGYTPVKGIDYFDGKPGEKGEPGEKGDKGDTGEQGIQGVQGAKGETGATGEKGADGTPATHRWSGTTLYITSASGTSSANLKGDKGDTGKQGEPGKDGANGKDGTSATHSWNGTVLTITSASGTSSADLKGEKGDKGDTGAQGIQGEKGEKGDPGEQGIQGVKGDPGPAGTNATINGVNTLTIAAGDGISASHSGNTLNLSVAGTFAGQVVANSSGQTPGTSLLRNSKLVSAETNPTVNGEICWTYE